MIMNSDSTSENAATIYQLLEELQTQLSVLEKQVKSGPFPVQSKIKSVEVVMPEEAPPVLEDAPS